MPLQPKNSGATAESHHPLGKGPSLARPRSNSADPKSRVAVPMEPNSSAAEMSVHHGDNVGSSKPSKPKPSLTVITTFPTSSPSGGSSSAPCSPKDFSSISALGLQAQHNSVDDVLESMSVCSSSVQMPRRKLIALQISVVVLLFWIMNLFQETIMKHSPFAQFPTVMGLGLNCSAFCVAGVEATVTGRKTRIAPLRQYIGIGLFAALESASSMIAMHLLNFPTWVLFKSCGVVVTMIGGVFILKKVYTLPEVLRVVTIAIGLGVFLLGDVSVTPDFDPRGVALILFSMVMSSFEGNIQEATFSRFSPPANEMMLYVPLVTIIFLTPILFYIGDMERAFMSFGSNLSEPLSVVGLGLLNSLGYYFYLSLIRTTSALTAAMVTAFRKMISILTSFWLFSKPWSSNYLFGGLLVVGALALEFKAKRDMQMAADNEKKLKAEKVEDSEEVDSSSPPSRKDLALFVAVPLIIGTAAFAFFYELLIPGSIQP